MRHNAGHRPSLISPGTQSGWPAAGNVCGAPDAFLKLEQDLVKSQLASSQNPGATHRGGGKREPVQRQIPGQVAGPESNGGPLDSNE